MAYRDYAHCSICDCKAFYDASVDYPEDIKIAILCEECAKTHEINIKLLESQKVWKPEFLAQKFWDMDSKEQATFFNVLANISEYNKHGEKCWTNMQWRYMQNSLTKKGKELIDNIKNHTDEL